MKWLERSLFFPPRPQLPGQNVPQDPPRLLLPLPQLPPQLSTLPATSPACPPIPIVGPSPHILWVPHLWDASALLFTRGCVCCGKDLLAEVSECSGAAQQ